MQLLLARKQPPPPLPRLPLAKIQRILTLDLTLSLMLTWPTGMSLLLLSLNLPNTSSPLIPNSLFPLQIPSLIHCLLPPWELLLPSLLLFPSMFLLLPFLPLKLPAGRSNPSLLPFLLLLCLLLLLFLKINNLPVLSNLPINPLHL